MRWDDPSRVGHWPGSHRNLRKASANMYAADQCGGNSKNSRNGPEAKFDTHRWCKCRWKIKMSIHYLNNLKWHRKLANGNPKRFLQSVLYPRCWKRNTQASCPACPSGENLQRSCHKRDRFANVCRSGPSKSIHSCCSRPWNRPRWSLDGSGAYRTEHDGPVHPFQYAPRDNKMKVDKGVKPVSYLHNMEQVGKVSKFPGLSRWITQRLTRIVSLGQDESQEEGTITEIMLIARNDSCKLSYWSLIFKPQRLWNQRN